MEGWDSEGKARGGGCMLCKLIKVEEKVCHHPDSFCLFVCFVHHIVLL